MLRGEKDRPDHPPLEWVAVICTSREVGPRYWDEKFSLVKIAAAWGTGLVDRRLASAGLAKALV